MFGALMVWLTLVVLGVAFFRSPDRGSRVGILLALGGFMIVVGALSLADDDLIVGLTSLVFGLGLLALVPRELMRGKRVVSPSTSSGDDP